MHNISINGKEYGYVVNYKNDDMLRNSFNSLTKKVYGFDFTKWYSSGYWGDRYRPYSLLMGDTMVSNISVNVMDFRVLGETRTYIQIGTVMTDPEYRHQGLNRALLEAVMAELRGKCDLIYLFTNDSVLDFYPKFGFNRAQEYQYSKEVSYCEGSQLNVTKLKMSDNHNKKFLLDKINRSLPCSQMSMLDNSALVLFGYTVFMQDNVYYIQELDAIAVADFDQDVLYLKDIFCEQVVSLDLVISALLNQDIKKVVLGFTPIDKTSFDENVLVPVDALFILDDKRGLFDNNKIQFPVLSHA